MEGILIFLCILAFLALCTLLVCLIKGANKDEVEKAKILPPVVDKKWTLRAKYVQAYEWAVKHLTVDTNAYHGWKALEKDKQEERFEYDLCYHVSQYSHYRPRKFPEMKNKVSNGSIWKCYGATEFMKEFIEIVDDMKKDHDLVELCDQYKVPVEFGAIGANRKYQDKYKDLDGRWL